MSKQSKKGLVPQLRFPEFCNESNWESVYGNQAFKQISNKKHNSDLPILAITQEHGAIPREMIDYNVSVTAKSIQSYKVVDVGDFIISLRSFQGGIEYSEYKGLCSPAYVVLRNLNGVNKSFFKHYFKTSSFIRDLTKNLEGLRDGKMISYKQFSEVLLPKPTPNEQKKIADCFTSIDELITAQTQKLDALKAHKKGLIQQLFPAEGETVPKLRFPAFRGKGEWKKKPLGKLSTIVRGGSPRPIESYLTRDVKGLNWLKIGDVDKESKYVTYTEERVKESALSKTRVVNPGDLIMSNSMSFGRPYILRIKSCIHDGWIAVTEINDDIDRDYLYYAILSHYSQLYFLNSAAGGGVKNLNANIIKLLPVTFPKLISEQQKIADCLASIDELIIVQSQKVDVLKAHKKGLMQQLFPGMVDV